MIIELSSERIEYLFVKTFLVKQARDRALFLLNSKKKRQNFFAELHGGDQRLIADFIQPVKSYALSKEVEIFESLLGSYGGEEVCYIMSYISEIDGVFLPLRDALRECLDQQMPTVLVCSDNLALLRGEIVVKPWLWILHRNK
jgi:hypothetical protein